MRILSRNFILALIPHTYIRLLNNDSTLWCFMHSSKQSSEPSHIFWMDPVSVVLSGLLWGGVEGRDLPAQTFQIPENTSQEQSTQTQSFKKTDLSPKANPHGHILSLTNISYDRYVRSTYYVSEDVGMNMAGTVPYSHRVCNLVGFTSLDLLEFGDMSMKLTGSVRWKPQKKTRRPK